MASHYLAIEGWFDFDDIYDLALRRCGDKPARLCEVGAYKGRSTCYLAERVRETGLAVELHIVDTFAGDPEVGYQDLWPEFAANMQRAGVLGMVDVRRATSLDAARSFADGSLDFVFIDADHALASVTGDLEAWWPKLRAGGMLAGHDYSNFAGVALAVDRFVERRGLQSAFRTSRSSWLLYKSISIDAVYCINLASRPDRRAAATRQFEQAGLLGCVQFVDAVDGASLAHAGHISDGQAGCVASHLRAMKDAAARGLRQLLLFEDDVELVPDFASRLKGALARCPASYDLFYVGALCRGDWGNYLQPFDDGLARAGHVFGTHSYVLNLDCIAEVEPALSPLGRVIDHCYAEQIQRRGNAYVCTPYLAFQSPGFSDISKTRTETRIEEYVWR